MAGVSYPLASSTIYLVNTYLGAKQYAAAYRGILRDMNAQNQAAMEAGRPAPIDSDTNCMVHKCA